MSLRKSRRRAPTPPKNVRWIDRDGVEHPCTTVYEGFKNGKHYWVATSTRKISGASAVVDIKIDELPGNYLVNIDIPMAYELPGSS